eukprot:TRINITY_DN21711_c0_g1_i1.p1 TRINITY_DN21711_c0_g1~~TRINITY_DN21711_c0_g1_i1.p1  ORF type:complete len:416 (+),score=70.12 TRINITY_DN21711_c0_g1_i1:127-1374(+)
MADDVIAETAPIPERPKPKFRRKVHEGTKNPLFKQLLEEKTPAEAAEWFAKHLADLNREGDIKDSPLYELATAANDASTEEAAKLVAAVVQGVGELPAKTRSEVVRQCTSVAEAMQTGNSDESARFSQNLAAIAEVVAKSGRPQGEVQLMTQVAQDEVQTILQKNPQIVLDTVTALPQAERKRVMTVVDKSQALPEAQKKVLTEAIKPGGYADQIQDTLKFVDVAYARRYAVPAVAAAEVFMSIWLGRRACSNGLISWLYWDGLLSLATCLAVVYTCKTLAPVYYKLREDMQGTIAGIQRTIQSGWKDWDPELTGMEMDAFQNAKIGAALSFFLLGFSAFWATLGFLSLLDGFLLMRCSLLALLVCIAFVGVRCGTLFEASRCIRYIRLMVQKLSAAPPNPSYGSTKESNESSLP